jgi:hypothetical protein
MKPKTEESRSIPPPIATRYPAMGPDPAAPESGGAAVRVRAERDGNAATPGGATVPADGVPADAEGAGAVPSPDTVSCAGTLATPGSVTMG